MAADTIIRTYDPKKILVSFNGKAIVGYAEDTFLSIARQGNSMEVKKGADGTIARANQNSKTFTVKFTILQTSLSNNDLLELLNQDIDRGEGIKALEIFDATSGKVILSAQAWIEKDPDYTWGSKVNEREWTLHTGMATIANLA